ncbi:nicotinate (nicotinamide) nucleotide adenylyltransferase [Reinekea sp. G2M2-21]|uniref:nicotinate (nicotinamide) nucleotide adenylyltransferase n=1 Tax=Reinekea sp. G2M2-21 TaxID=2788942 RepID=UPI0018A99B6B
MNPDKPIVAVYGGTFDPFHKGHEAVVDSVLSHPEIAQLRLIPCYLPALKAEASASAKHRLAMLAAWREAHTERERIAVDAIEISRSGPSYTIDTIEALQTCHPQWQILFVLGVDAWNSLPHWHRIDDLTQRVNFWVFNRAGEDRVIRHPDLRESNALSVLLTSSKGRFWLDPSVNKAVSSSAFRAQPHSEFRILPDSITNYVTTHGLYQ